MKEKFLFWAIVFIVVKAYLCLKNVFFVLHIVLLQYAGALFMVYIVDYVFYYEHAFRYLRTLAANNYYERIGREWLNYSRRSIESRTITAEDLEWLSGLHVPPESFVTTCKRLLGTPKHFMIVVGVAFFLIVCPAQRVVIRPTQFNKEKAMAVVTSHD